MSEQIRARKIRIKTYLEMLRDGILAYWDGDPATTDTTALSTFVYADTGEDVPKDALVVPWGSDDVPEEKLRRLEDILDAYASKRGWDYMEIGDEDRG
jgi:hypothetical protein